MIRLITRDGCPNCMVAKENLATMKISYEEVKIGVDITRDDVLELYPGYRVLPIVLVDGIPIGSLIELNESLNWRTEHVKEIPGQVGHEYHHENQN